MELGTLPLSSQGENERVSRSPPRTHVEAATWEQAETPTVRHAPGQQLRLVTGIARVCPARVGGALAHQRNTTAVTRRRLCHRVAADRLDGLPSCSLFHLASMTPPSASFSQELLNGRNRMRRSRATGSQLFPVLTWKTPWASAATAACRGQRPMLSWALASAPASRRRLAASALE